MTIRDAAGEVAIGNKIDEFCGKIDEFCIENDEFCIQNDGITSNLSEISLEIKLWRSPLSRHTANFD